ncbi:MAG: hypothetical protein K2X60_13020 [Xanthobacteraceae bacterium]|nr:hypothetical protein [Xanthobacteraceae bacterium]
MSNMTERRSGFGAAGVTLASRNLAADIETASVFFSKSLKIKSLKIKSFKNHSACDEPVRSFCDKDQGAGAITFASAPLDASRFA